MVNVKVVSQTTDERKSEFEELYQRYKAAYTGTDMSIKTILSEVLDISESSSLHRQLQRKLFEDTGVDAITRREHIKKGEWIKLDREG